MTTKGILCGLLAVTVALAQQGRREQERTTRYAVRGVHGAIATGGEPAADAGLRIFVTGGNAVDAGVAGMFAASITEYSHFGFGGEAPILIRTRDGKVFSIAGVGTMPQLATAEFFRARRIKPGEILNMEPNGLKGLIPVAGMMPALVPGMVDGGLLALREFGTRSFAEVIQPAIELADGTALDEVRFGSIMRSRRFFDLWPASKNVFMAGGQTPHVGDVFRQADLARTLRSMVEEEKRALKAGMDRASAIDRVRDYFYRGEIARRIDQFSRDNNGLLRYDDLAAFRLKLEPAVATTYRGYTVHKPGFWSQGPSLLQALNMLEADDPRALGHNSPEYIHRLVEVLKLAYADRDTYYGDPLFAKVPMETLLSKAYAEERRRLVGARSSMEFRPGRIDGFSGIHPSAVDMARVRIDDELMARDTTCIDAIDRDGLMFAATPSGAWLPSVIAGDTGIPLTQRAQSFLLTEGHPNELGGGKRPRVTLSPALVTRNGQPMIALSTPGGDNQDQALLQMFLNVVEFGMNAQQAVEAPRFETRHLVSSFDNHAMNPGELALDERIPAATASELSGRGHIVQSHSRWASGARPVLVRVTPQGVIEAGADPYGHRAARAW